MNIALILSGGTGTRLGTGTPKQYLAVQGKPIISYCVETLSAHEGIDTIQIVAKTKWRANLVDWLGPSDKNKKFRGFSEPGCNRQMSILNGLEDISQYADGSDIVLIHDAARPSLTQGQITACLAGLKGHDGVVPVLPMKDTVYLSEDGKRVSSLLERGKVLAGQAPECFLLGKYLEANRQLLPDRILRVNGSTEPAIIVGMEIAVIPGDENNFKITTQADLDRFYGIASAQGGWI